METKTCFKCGLKKDLTSFYKHPQMADGRFNKCKECTKNDIHLNYMANIENPEYVEKERARGRDKYARLNYKVRSNAHDENKNTRRDLKKAGIDLAGLEVHHWNYEFKKDIFILTPRAHKLVHKYIVFDGVSKFIYNEILLSTKDEHLKAIKSILSIHYVKPNIGIYPII